MQKIIDIYGKHYLEGLLNNPKQLERLYAFSYRARMGEENVNPELENVEQAIDLYMMNQILIGKVDKKMLTNYRYVFNKMLQIDTMGIFRNPILKLPYERLKLVMDENTYQKLQKRKHRIEENCKKIGKKLESHEQITNKEQDLLIKFLTSNIGTRDKDIYSMQEEMVKKIFNENQEWGYKEAEFIVRFIGEEELKEYDIEGFCHLSEYNVSSTKKCESTKRGAATDCRMIVRRDYGINAINSKKDLGSFIHTICHEVKHLDQNDKKSNGTRNEDTLSCLMDNLLDKYLSDKDYSYYKLNYYFESGEVSAELSGFNSAVAYLKKYGKRGKIDDLLRKKDEQIYKKMIEKRRNEEKKQEDALTFKYREVGNIIRNHPEVLKKYPQLRSVYQKNGELKSIETLLIEKGSFKKRKKKDNSNIYHQALTLLIDQGKLSILNISNMSENEIYSCMHGLSDLYNSYANSSHNYLAAKRLKDQFVKDKNNAQIDLDHSVQKMKMRCQKIETVLDILYERFGKSYKEHEKYRQDAFIYQKDKMYTRMQFHEIKEEEKKIQLESMLKQEPIIDGNHNHK